MQELSQTGNTGMREWLSNVQEITLLCISGFTHGHALGAISQGPAFTKIPLARVGAWRFRNISKEYGDAYENNKTEKYRIVPGGSSSEY